MASLMDKAKQFVSDAAASIEKPKASVTDVDLKDVGVSCVTYLAKINVSNPYSVSIPIGEIRYVLKSSGSEIASGTVPDPGSLKGDSETMLNVDIKVAHSVLVSLVKDIGRDWDIDYDLKVTLVVDLPLIGNISIPVTSADEATTKWSIDDIIQEKSNACYHNGDTKGYGINLKLFIYKLELNLTVTNLNFS